MRARKKPLEVEVFQATREAMGHRSDRGAWPPWLREAGAKAAGEPGSLYRLYNQPDMPFPLVITTLEGEHECGEGDWIIRGVKGELYPCKADVFAMSYDLVEGS